MKKTGLIVSVFLFVGAMACSSNSFSAEVNLPRTGQTDSFTTADDGSLQTGLPLPSPRFTNNDNGTVTDNLTGLVWLRNADCLGLTTWANALGSAAALANGSCGLTDGSTTGQWRLPTVLELESLVDRSKVNPVLSTGHPFNSVQNDYYWSSTSLALETSGAWIVGAGDGTVVWGDKYSTEYFWPVRD